MNCNKLRYEVGFKILEQALGYALKSRGCPVPVAPRVEVNQPLTSPEHNAPKGDLLAISTCEGGNPCENWVGKGRFCLFEIKILLGGFLRRKIKVGLIYIAVSVR